MAKESAPFAMPEIFLIVTPLKLAEFSSNSVNSEDMYISHQNHAPAIITLHASW